MSDFFEELAEGEIHQRDKYQFELKSEYIPTQSHKDPSYSTEIYIFIPKSLQINPDTYTKSQFYLDQTSMIRYKTPSLTFDQLISDEEPKSPLVVLMTKMVELGKVPPKEALFEFKLFANMIRSGTRDRVRELSRMLYSSDTEDKLKLAVIEIDKFLDEIGLLKGTLKRFSKKFFGVNEHDALRQDWAYIDEYMSVILQHYLANLLEIIRKWSLDLFCAVDERLCLLIEAEEEFRAGKKFGTSFSRDKEVVTSRTIYRLSLLNKYIYEVLFLKIKRKEPKTRVREITASFAAGFAMMVYLILFTWHGVNFVIDSTAFIAIGVLLYVLKDRLKEGVRNWSTTFASKWYPDYNTDILSPDNEEKIGRVKEYFSFLDQSTVPEEVIKTREEHFHDELEKIKRPETIIYYKKEVEIWPEAVKENKRLRKVNDIFRYNLSQYLVKASDASQDYHYLDPISHHLETLLCSKLYHVNIILKKTYVTKQHKRRIELDKFRVILDKEGIKRIEKI